MTDADDHALESRAVRRAFERAGDGYDAHALVAERAQAELFERLQLIGFEPASVLDLGCGTGRATRALKDCWRGARVVGLDASAAMLRVAGTRRGLLRRFARVRADAARLPFRDAAFDLVWSNLLLPWVDLDAALVEVRRVLVPRGYFTFAALGPDTLRELLEAWAAVDTRVHVHAFVEMHDLGDALVRAGFADAVLDVERVTLTYPDLPALVRELRALGATNAAAGRPRALGGRARLARLLAACDARREHGRLPATCELVYGQAWRPGAEPPRRGRRGEIAIPIERVGRRPR